MRRPWTQRRLLYLLRRPCVPLSRAHPGGSPLCPRPPTGLSPPLATAGAAFRQRRPPALPLWHGSPPPGCLLGHPLAAAPARRTPTPASRRGTATEAAAAPPGPNRTEKGTRANPSTPHEPAAQCSPLAPTGHAIDGGNQAREPARKPGAPPAPGAGHHPRRRRSTGRTSANAPSREGTRARRAGTRRAERKQARRTAKASGAVGKTPGSEGAARRQETGARGDDPAGGGRPPAPRSDHTRCHPLAQGERQHPARPDAPTPAAQRPVQPVIRTTPTRRRFLPATSGPARRDASPVRTSRAIATER